MATWRGGIAVAPATVLSNPEIGARLFLSPRIVESHVRQVFTKPGVRSRRELASALPASEPQFVPS